MQKCRLLWIDIAKGIAILLIIMGHTVTGTMQRLIYSFHVPLFLILSGYTFSLKEETFLVSLKKDFKRLIVPVLVVCALRFTINSLHQPAEIVLHFKNTVLSLLWGNANYYEPLPGIGHIWFLIDLFLARQFYRLIRQKIIKCRLTFVCILAFVGIFVGERIWLPFSFDLVLVSLLFMEVGSILRKLDGLPHRITSIIGCSSFIIWLHLAYTNHVFVEMAARNFSLPATCLLTIVCGSICVMQFSQAIESIPLVSRSLAFLGQHSLLLLCIHALDNFVSPIWNLTFLRDFSISSIPDVLTSLCYISFILRAAIDIAILLCILAVLRLIRKQRIVSTHAPTLP